MLINKYSNKKSNYRFLSPILSFFPILKLSETNGKFSSYSTVSDERNCTRFSGMFHYNYIIYPLLTDTFTL